MRKNYLIAQVGEVRFYAKHQILRELILLILQQSEVPSNLSINVFVGIHHWVDDFLPSDVLNIGIQTEQFFDANGQKLWGTIRQSHLRLLCLKFDVILDFTDFNSLAYKNINKHCRLVFGPYIFPKNKVYPSNKKSTDICFVGGINERRDRIISALSSEYSIKVIRNVFGDHLNKIVCECAGILNIHFQDGVYTEWPRILLAYLNGVILISEDMGHPLIEGRHYVSIYSDLSGFCASEIHENIWNDLAVRYSFSDFLSESDFKKIRLKPMNRWFLLICTVYMRVKTILKKFERFFRKLLKSHKLIF
jgi:hypothetical protein